MTTSSDEGLIVLALQKCPVGISGDPRSGKTLLGLFVSFEETAAELAQNTASLGWRVAGLVERGQLSVAVFDKKRRAEARPAEIGTSEDSSLT